MNTLLVGFDSAWTAGKAGAIVGAARMPDGTYIELGAPSSATFATAAAIISRWQEEYRAASTLILLDQPTVVRNAVGQRPVENLVASPVSLRYGGVQPASLKRAEMFGPEAPLWPFLTQFDAGQDPWRSGAASQVLETYPVLAMIGLGWILPDNVRPTGHLPKYNPERRSTFDVEHWTFVCQQAAAEVQRFGLVQLGDWLIQMGEKRAPRKEDQDCVDACICLIVGLHVTEEHECLLVGEPTTGYMVVPRGDTLCSELERRCIGTGRDPARWVRLYQRTSNVGSHDVSAGRW